MSRWPAILVSAPGQASRRVRHVEMIVYTLGYVILVGCSMWIGWAAPVWLGAT